MNVSKIQMSVVLTVLAMLTAVSSTVAQGGELQNLRNWLAESIRGEESGSDIKVAFSTDDSEAIPAHIQKNSRGLAADIAAILNERIGWLIPRSVKERALLWLIIAVGLPWLFTSTLRAMLRFEEVAIGYLVVAVWSGSAVWLGWQLWGAASGADRFVSSLMILFPVLFVYFTGIVRSLGPEQPAKE